MCGVSRRFGVWDWDAGIWAGDYEVNVEISSFLASCWKRGILWGFEAGIVVVLFIGGMRVFCGDFGFRL